MTAGKHIKCKYCQYDKAKIILEDRRNKVRCGGCGSEYYLKEQHIKMNPKDIEIDSEATN